MFLSVLKRSVKNGNDAGEYLLGETVLLNQPFKMILKIQFVNIPELLPAYGCIRLKES